MKRIERLRRELAALRKELDFIAGQLHNERILGTMDCGMLTNNEIDRLEIRNEKLISEIVLLEAALAA